MTEEEQDAELGRMHRERKDRRQEFVCLNNKLERFRCALIGAADAAKSGKGWHSRETASGHEIQVQYRGETFTCPSPDSLLSALEQRDRVESRIAQLDKSLDG